MDKITVPRIPLSIQKIPKWYLCLPPFSFFIPMVDKRAIANYNKGEEKKSARQGTIFPITNKKTKGSMVIGEQGRYGD
jgi:hypothetical protein